MNANESGHTFACDFGGGVRATAQINVEALRKGKGKTQYVFVEWEGKPSREHTAAYRAWMLTVQQRAADLLHERIFWAIQTDANTCEYYELEPGKPCRRIVC